jgi:branched-chain amino acid transport system permease protein
MTEFLQQLLNGLSLGAIYALIALGYTMVYGVLRFINFAHSDVFMVGAFIGYYAGEHLPHGTIGGGLLALAAAMAGCAVLGILIERLVYRPLRGGPTLNVLITAIGMSLFLEYTGQLVFGATPRAFPAIFPSSVIAIHGLIISANQIIVIIVAGALMLALQFAVYGTKIGTAMRAVALNPKAAQLVGVNIDVAAAGGVLYAMNYPSIDPLMGVVPGLKAFVAAVLGGIGNIPGAALGALILGMVETFVDGSRWSTYKDAIAFAILIGILLFRPAGLLGRYTAEKV